MRGRLRKYLWVALILLLTLSALTVTSFADSREEAKVKTDEVLSDFFEIVPDNLLDKAEAGASALSIDAILADVISAVRAGGASAGSFLFLLLGISLLLGVSGVALLDTGGTALGGITVVASVGLLAALLPLVTEISEAFSAIGAFFSSLIPILASLIALSGGGATAAAASSGMLLTLRVFGGICSALLPLSSAIFVGAAVSSIAKDGFDTTLGAPRRWFVKGTGLLTALLGGFVAMQTSIASATDSAAMRAAKYAATGTIPVVGQAVSGALATLSGGLSYAGGVLGGGAVAVIVSLTVAPLVKLLLYRLCFFLSGLLLDVFPSGAGGKCISAMASALDGLIAVYSLGALIFIFEVVLAVRCSAHLI